MLSEVAITRLASEPSEAGDRMDPTTFFDDSSSSSNSSDEKKTEISRVQGPTSKKHYEEVSICSPPKPISSFYGPICTTPDVTMGSEKTLNMKEVLPPPKSIELSRQHQPENSIARSALTRATMSKTSPVFNEFCRVASWAEEYESAIRDYRLEAAVAASPTTFEFIFAIPLRRIDGMFNKQWSNCQLTLLNSNEVRVLRKLFIDPYNQDVLFAVTLPRADFQGQAFYLAPGDESDRDGPYTMPKTDAPVVSLRDGNLAENDSALECGIEMDVSGIADRESKMLAYWHEVSNQWLHVPLKSLTKVLIHQKRCVVNVFDIHRGRVTDDRLIMQAGVYSW